MKSVSPNAENTSAKRYLIINVNVCITLSDKIWDMILIVTYFKFLYNLTKMHWGKVSSQFLYILELNLYFFVLLLRVRWIENVCRIDFNLYSHFKCKYCKLFSTTVWYATSHLTIFFVMRLSLCVLQYIYLKIAIGTIELRALAL